MHKLAAVCRYSVSVFAWFAEEGAKPGFKNVASGPLVHADQQTHGDTIN